MRREEGGVLVRSKAAKTHATPRLSQLLRAGSGGGGLAGDPAQAGERLDPAHGYSHFKSWGGGGDSSDGWDSVAARSKWEKEGARDKEADATHHTRMKSKQVTAGKCLDLKCCEAPRQRVAAGNPQPRRPPYNRPDGEAEDLGIKVQGSGSELDMKNDYFCSLCCRHSL